MEEERIEIEIELSQKGQSPPESHYDRTTWKLLMLTVENLETELLMILFQREVMVVEVEHSELSDRAPQQFHPISSSSWQSCRIVSALKLSSMNLIVTECFTFFAMEHTWS